MGTHSPECSIFKEVLLKGFMFNSAVIKNNSIGKSEEFPTVGCGNVPGFGLFFVLRAEQGEYFCRSLIKVNVWAFCASK